MRSQPGIWGILFLWPCLGWAGGLPTLDAVEVVAGRQQLLGTATTASEGRVSAEQLKNRPLLRPAELLETVPGLIVTQHSGDGKANQYFLRGFNLDHGTDFASFVDGIPVNMPSHGHGQGYTDLNFLIPELIDSLQYRKGPYAAEDGDFAAAGSARLRYRRSLAQPFAQLTLGADHYRRGLLAGSRPSPQGEWLGALEWSQYDGPWQVAQDKRQLNGLLKLARGSAENGWALSLMGYDSEWTATDQIPQRALRRGELGRYGSLDPTSGGRSHRYSLSGEWAEQTAQGRRQAQLYALDYRLRLYSNFTYFLNDPVNGDQFSQADRRQHYGAQLSQTWFGTLAGRGSDTRLGLQLRHDAIDPVGLYLSRQRQRLATIREDEIALSHVGLYLDKQTEWQPWLRSVLGLRHDYQHFDVSSDRPANSGSGQDRLTSPKLNLILGPWAHSEFYLSYGRGFHSNDARGASIRLNPDPRDEGFLQPAPRLPLLVQAQGAEVGLRSAWRPGLSTSLALWRLRLDSELVFVGDAGRTEASRPSQRQGLELANYYTPRPGLILDADLALSSARFRDRAPEGRRIPGAVERTASLGLSLDTGGPWFGGLRVRHVGPRPLLEDDSVRAKSTTLLNARLGWRPRPGTEFSLDLLNLLDRDQADIEYFYASCLASEAATADCDAAAPGRAGLADRHVHPAEPRSLRFGLRLAL